MKLKYIASALVLAGIAATASADKTPEQLRVYINPGHGSWTGNDRPMQVIGKPAYSSTNTDTTGFFETNTNLIKGFGMLETLIEMGMPFDRTLNQDKEERWLIGAAKDLSQNIVMSRVKNGPYEAENTTSSDNYMLYNRALLEIATEVEYNEFDQFVSIHSNAASEGNTTNYHLMMYRGHNGKDNVLAPGSWEMAEAAWKYSFANTNAGWSTSSVYINGDIDFMSSDKTGSTNSLGYYGYLGVLKHGCPGYLVEGYFHTYQPARHRGMNFDVDWVEGAQYARGVAEYWNFAKRGETGEIYGIVRDMHQKFSHSLYKPNPKLDDRFLPLNGATAVLEKGGVKVAEYTTDQFYNGAFVFTGLEPGKYTVTVSHPDYTEGEPFEVEVKAGTTTYPTTTLEAKDYVPEGVQLVDYPDPATAAFGARDEYAFNTVFALENIAELQDKTIRRTLMRGDLVYILATKQPTPGENEQYEPTILVYNVAKKEVVATVSTEGMQGLQAKCSDIQLTNDGVLLGCNKDTNIYDGYTTTEYPTRGTWRLYRWENDENGLPTGNPIQHYTTQSSALWFRAHVGDTFAFTGNLTEGKAVVSAPTISAGGGLRLFCVTFMDGSGVTTDHKVNNTAPNADEQLGDGFRFLASPNDDKHFYMVGPGSAEITEFEYTHADQVAPTSVMPAGILAPGTCNIDIFRYAGHSYIAAAEAENGVPVALKLVDITEGLAEAKVVSTVNTALSVAEEPETPAEVPARAAGFNTIAPNFAVIATPGAEYDAEGAVKSVHINLGVVNEGAVTMLSTKGVAQAQTRAHFPYNLTMTREGMNATFKFDVSGDVNDSEVVLTNTEDATDKIVIPVGAVKAAEGAEVTYDVTALPSNYTWAVTTTSPAVADAAAYTVEPSVRPGTGRGGVVVINDPEQDSYGMTVVVQGNARGFDFYNQVGTRTAANLFAGAPFVASKINSGIRGGEFRGQAVANDWSDANAGLWAVDPLDTEKAPRQLFEGTKNSTGAYILDGKTIGGGGSGCAFQRNADDSYYLFMDEEDLGLRASNNDMVVVRYDIPAGSETIAEGPATDFGQKFSAASLMKSTQVDIKTWADGFVMAQMRALDNADDPGFIFATNDGDILFNSSALEDGATCNSGIALTTDLATLAVGTGDGIRIYSLKWKDGKPSFTFKYQIPDSKSDWAHLCFDPAGNLHSYSLENGYQMFTLVNAAPKATTPAKAELLVIGGESGIEAVAADNVAEGPAVYYNLQGVRVDAANLTPGIYVRTNGRTASKVVVR